LTKFYTHTHATPQFLVDHEGKVVKRFNKDQTSEKMRADVEKCIAAAGGSVGAGAAAAPEDDGEAVED
jgi:hypothetical protein